jgi:hypothetical protein
LPQLMGGAHRKCAMSAPLLGRLGQQEEKQNSAATSGEDRDGFSEFEHCPARISHAQWVRFFPVVRRAQKCAVPFQCSTCARMLMGHTAAAVLIRRCRRFVMNLRACCELRPCRRYVRASTLSRYCCGQSANVGSGRGGAQGRSASASAVIPAVHGETYAVALHQTTASSADEDDEQLDESGSAAARGSDPSPYAFGNTTGTSSASGVRSTFFSIISYN